jgi:hypothetical protein
MSQFAWYWHRLRAMTPAEVVLHARKKLRQFADARFQCDWQSDWQKWEMKASSAFPPLPYPGKAPEVLREALKGDVEEILAGRWKAFGHLELRVDDPPRWQKDYLADRDLTATESAFKLNHRSLPGGADIKLIWELSRWHELVRLAMSAHVLSDERAARKCMEWLEDWVKENPPYRGWNWTSALEVGMRLIQFTWIDALLSNAGARTALSALPAANESVRTRLSALRWQILGPHTRFVWRYKSFGSSANNHLLGELAGLIVATVRWPALPQWAGPLDELQRLWEREVLAQFAEDGGNKEQALNYQLFSWELCWQSMFALYGAGRPISPDVCLRLYQAADFFVKMQVDGDAWDYGDSDGGFVTPFFARAMESVREWRNWMTDRARSPAIDYWLGETRRQFKEQLVASTSPAERTLAKCQPASKTAASPEEDWLHYASSGQCIARVGQWSVRWDLSPLGYLATAAHGHLDALHLSLWLNGVGVIIDPGTGVYYADPTLRNWLASPEAHNGPCLIGIELSKRLGTFLWDHPHPVPVVTRNGASLTGVLNLTSRQLRRTLTHSPASVSWTVQDVCLANDGNAIPFTVRWQFAPGTWVKVVNRRTFAVHRGDVAVTLIVADDWAEVHLIERESDRPADDHALAGFVSPAFRKVVWAPYLKLAARPLRDKPCVFRTTFLASPHS